MEEWFCTTTHRDLLQEVEDISAKGLAAEGLAAEAAHDLLLDADAAQALALAPQRHQQLVARALCALMQLTAVGAAVNEVANCRHVAARQAVLHSHALSSLG